MLFNCFDSLFLFVKNLESTIVPNLNGFFIILRKLSERNISEYWVCCKCKSHKVWKLKVIKSKVEKTNSHRDHREKREVEMQTRINLRVKNVLLRDSSW